VNELKPVAPPSDVPPLVTSGVPRGKKSLYDGLEAAEVSTVNGVDMPVIVPIASPAITVLLNASHSNEIVPLPLGRVTSVDDV
jgi:hypothetical protein